MTPFPFPFHLPHNHICARRKLSAAVIYLYMCVCKRKVASYTKKRWSVAVQIPNELNIAQSMMIIIKMTTDLSPESASINITPHALLTRAGTSARNTGLILLPKKRMYLNFINL